MEKRAFITADTKHVFICKIVQLLIIIQRTMNFRGKNARQM